MTNNATTLTQKAGRLKRFAEYPPRDDMQNWRYIYDPGLLHSLGIHLRKTFPHSTVMCEVPLARSLSRRDSVRIPDMSVMLDGDRALMEEQSGYEIETHGKPPDFALEVASPTTGIVDYTAKRLDYERFGVLEYWRFDPSGGRFHDAPLAADRLVNGEYIPIEITIEPDGRLWGYSEVLRLELWWDESMLRFRDPATGDFLRTPEEIYADYQAAEARLAEMEAELRRLRGE
ncbi:MAG: Uma2 family endonuclease [Chloroflexi bacterium]|nr:Uma2 family endonuclease [Chloroflexota bacterium]